MTSQQEPASGPALAFKAQLEPSLLGRGHDSLWDDIREVLLDPEPDSRALETIRRWLRDEAERDLHEELCGDEGSELVRWACKLAPPLIWKLPHSRSSPPRRFHRRIVAILLPQRLHLLEEALSLLAFQDGLQGPGRRGPI